MSRFTASEMCRRQQSVDTENRRLGDDDADLLLMRGPLSIFRFFKFLAWALFIFVLFISTHLKTRAGESWRQP